MFGFQAFQFRFVACYIDYCCFFYRFLLCFLEFSYYNHYLTISLFFFFHFSSQVVFVNCDNGYCWFFCFIRFCYVFQDFPSITIIFEVNQVMYFIPLKGFSETYFVSTAKSTHKHFFPNFWILVRRRADSEFCVWLFPRFVRFCYFPLLLMCLEMAARDPLRIHM